MKTRISRRELAAAVTGLTGLGFLGKSAFAVTGGPPKRFISIFLSGAWNANLSIDPVVGTKLTGGFFDPAYKTLETSVVAGKPKLRVGPGFLPAMAGFAAVPTAFVNGLQMEITAHDIAGEIVLTGSSRALRTDGPHAGLTAHMGAARGGFPAHVMLGGRVPMLGTADTGPGIFASDVTRLGASLKAPSTNYADATWARATEMVDKLDGMHRRALEGPAAAFADSWMALRRRVLKAAAEGGAAVQMTSDVQTRYGTKDAGSAAGLMAGAFLVLAGDLTRYVHLTIGGFDTHSNELTTQLPRQKAVAKGLGQLLLDLAGTPDPAAPDRMLIETTTVYLTSEFTRTPKFNGSAGTDHMPTASAIICGRGVRDGVVVGETSDKGYARGWVNGAGVATTDKTRLLPKYLAAGILEHMGLTQAAEQVSERTVDGLFT